MKIPQEVLEIIKNMDDVPYTATEQWTLHDRRVDTKMLVPLEALTEILRSVANKYLIVSALGEAHTGYSSLYFDTPSFFLYQMHHRGMRPRYKVRVRKYLNTGKIFWEIKMKDNKGITCKKRLPLEEEVTVVTPALASWSTQFIQPGIVSTLAPITWISYDRITLVNKPEGSFFEPERITIDFGVEYRLFGSEREDTASFSLSSVVVVEVKHNKFMSRTPFMEEAVLKKRMKSTRFSKYCFGLACLCQEVKINRMKPIMLGVAGKEEHIKSMIWQRLKYLATP